MNETNELNEMDDELVDAMAQHLALRIGEMVADSLRVSIRKLEREYCGHKIRTGK